MEGINSGKCFVETRIFEVLCVHRQQVTRMLANVTSKMDRGKSPTAKIRILADTAVQQTVKLKE